MYGDLPWPTEAEIPQTLPYETEIYRNILFPTPIPKVRETTFGREKHCPCSSAGTPPYIHFWHLSLPTPLHTEYKHSLENSKHSSIHDAVLGGSQQVAVTGGPNSNGRFVCKEAQVRGGRSKSGALEEPVSITAWLQSKSLTSIRLARIELWRLEQVEKDSASEPGSWLRILLTTS